MSVLTREELFEEGALRTEIVPLKKGEVIVSEIGGSDYIALWSDPKNQKTIDGKETLDMSRFTPALLSFAVVDESGKRLFTEADIERLARFNSEVFLKLSEVARRLNGLSGEEEKNSEGSQSDLPSSDSASTSDSDTLTN